MAKILKSNLSILVPYLKSGEFVDFVKQICNDCEVYSGNSKPFRKNYKIVDIKL